MPMDSVRVAFKFGGWRPTQTEWLAAVQRVQLEEKTRIGKFVFQRDAKSALSGRLLIRKVIHDVLGIPYREIKLLRTDKGKPYLDPSLVPSTLPNFNFNVSHQGDYAVLAAEPSHLVGVDVMKVEMPVVKSLDELFRTLRRQYTAQEWDMINKATDDTTKMYRFYRHWCLKESFVKALGEGIGFSFQRLNFVFKTEDLHTDQLVTDTKVYVDSSHAPQWRFEESTIDDDHIVAVATREPEDEEDEYMSVIDYMPVTSIASTCGPAIPFTILSLNDLLRDTEPVTESDPSIWPIFNAKDEHPPIRTVNDIP